MGSKQQVNRAMAAITSGAGCACTTWHSMASVAWLPAGAHQRCDVEVPPIKRCLPREAVAPAQEPAVGTSVKVGLPDGRLQPVPQFPVWIHLRKKAGAERGGTPLAAVTAVGRAAQAGARPVATGQRGRWRRASVWPTWRGACASSCSGNRIMWLLT